MSSLLQAWPVLVFIILTACIAGMVMWFVVSKCEEGVVRGVVPSFFCLGGGAPTPLKL